MPLINLVTDLKSLRYGPDRPGGGFSGQPYVVYPNPDGSGVQYTNQTTTDLFNDFISLNRDTQDFPIRGGKVTLGETGRFSTPAGEIDRRRIQAFLKDPQKGTIFILKQVGLQLSNPKTQVPGSIVAFDTNDLSNNFIETTRVYNPRGLTTLDQVLASGTGTHIPRHGLIPQYNGLFNSTYEDYVKNNNDKDSNRLSILVQAKLTTNTPIYPSFIGKAVDYGVSTLNNEILNYFGGPDSTYGIGATVIKRATNTNTGRAYSTIAYTYDTLINQQAPTGFDRAHPQIQDFRTKINEQAGSSTQPTADYAAAASSLAWWSPRRTGNPGATPLKNRINYSVDPGGNNKDVLNYLGPLSYNVGENTPWSADSDNTQDIIKFAFECLSNDTPGDAVALVFRAFLTSFTDNNQASFNSFNYLGRGETFRTYQGFDRSISFGFKIAAFSRQEMQPLYTKLNHLVSQIYPDYSPTSKFMRGSVIKLTIGDYLYRVPGFLENVNITVDNSTSWEIALDKSLSTATTFGVDSDMAQLPQVIDVQCNFKPIHDFLPRREKVGDSVVPLIANIPGGYLSGDIKDVRPAQQPQVVNNTQNNTLGNNTIGARNPTFTPPYNPGNATRFNQYQNDVNQAQAEQLSNILSKSKLNPNNPI